MGRFVLAGVFLVAIWLDPSQPSRAPPITYAILSGYLALSFVYAISTWNNAWLDWRLGLASHLFDIAMFGTLVFLTDGITSPFFTFFIFIILSATIRWSWRETALTAATVIVLFFAAGLLAFEPGREIEVQRTVMRGSYLIVLSAILIWIGMNQRPLKSHQIRILSDGDGSRGSPNMLIQPILEFARQTLKSGRLLLIWWEPEEPWVHVAEMKGEQFTQNRFGPDSFTPPVKDEFSDCPILFDIKGQRALISPSRAGRKLVRTPDVLDPALVEMYGLSEGLALPVKAKELEGHLLALDIPGLCVDDLTIGYQVGREISLVLQRASVVRLSEETAAARTRLSLSRDIHDGVMQLLAGTSFRLEGIAKGAAAGRDIAPDIKELQKELSLEQASLRNLLASLRSEKGLVHEREVLPGLEDLAARLSRQWSVQCQVAPQANAIEAPAPLEHDLHQLVREGVANAVRHGGAKNITLLVAADADGIHLTISDDGTGFASTAGSANGEVSGPWSLSERARSLGGSLSVFTGSTGSTIMVTLPSGYVR